MGYAVHSCIACSIQILVKVKSKDASFETRYCPRLLTETKNDSIYISLRDS